MFGKDISCMIINKKTDLALFCTSDRILYIINVNNFNILKNILVINIKLFFN